MLKLASSWKVGFIFSLLTGLSGLSEAATIGFGVRPGSGNVLFFGAGPLFGVGIGIDLVFGEDTPAGPPGPVACIECAMHFRTGEFLGSIDNAWIFDATGAEAGILITGGVDVTGDGTPEIGGRDEFLMAGAFLGPTVSVDLSPGELLSVGVITSLFIDVKNPALSALYGLEPFPFVGDMFLTWIGGAEPPGPIDAVALSGLVRNFAVPEPGVLWLCALALLAGLPRPGRL